MRKLSSHFSARTVSYSGTFLPRALICLLAASVMFGVGQPNSQAAAPPNDDISNATHIVTAPYTNVLDTTSATVAFDDPYSCAYPSHTVWYSRTPMQNVQIVANTLGSSYDTVLSVFTGPRGSLFLVACNDDFLGTQSQVSFPGQAGQTYYFMVGSFGTAGAGNLVFSIQEAARVTNDDFTNAIRILTLPYTNSEDTTTATTANDDPYACASPSHTVWYGFTATGNGRLQANASGSSYATVLAVFTGAPGKFVSVGCTSGQSSLIFDTIAGQTYYFMIGSAGTSAGNLVFALQQLTPPPNDDFTNATQIATLPYTNIVNTVAAAAAPEDPYACSYPSHTVWYALTLNHPARIITSTAGSDYDAAVTVLTGSPGAFTSIGCGNGGITFEAAANQPYYLMIGSYGVINNGGNLVFSVAELLPPPNDDFDHATPIASPSTNTVNLGLATRAPDDPVDCLGYGGTVWYLFTPVEDAFIEVTTLQSDYNSAIGVYTGSPGALQQVACSGCCRFGFPALAGHTYYLMAGSSYGGTFAFALNNYPLLKIGVSVDSVGAVDSRTGLATIHGIVTNSLPVTIELSGTVRQKAGRFHVVTAQFGTQDNPVFVQSSGQTSWTAQVLGDGGSFGGGAALVSVVALSYDPVTGQYAEAERSQTIQFKGKK